MLLGMLPALLVAVALVAVLVVLVLQVGDLVAWMTPFADDWSDGVRRGVRVLLALSLVAGAVVVAGLVFTGLTLAVGDPFYERIWRATEEMLGGPAPGDGLPLWRSVRDGLALAAVGLLSGVVILLAGLLPVVGTPLAVVGGLAVSGRLLAGELLARPLEARGYDRHARAALLRRHRRAVWAFGISTQACFWVPLGAVAVMPAAVAGATVLARDLLGERLDQQQPPTPGT